MMVLLRRLVSMMGLALLLVLLACGISDSGGSGGNPPPNPVMGLDTIASGLSSPVFLTSPPADSTRLFVVEQSGAIRVMRNDILLPAPFLDLTDSVSTGSEQGLLGMAFDPGYAGNGRFYVSYTRTSGNSVVARYQVSGNPELADPNSWQLVIHVPQPYSNHNGGMIVFGPDGYLYFGLGDGGGGGDPLGTGQDRSDLLGSILRLDVSGSGSGTYTIPADNPFTTNPGMRPELWNWGLRNPWRFSFDHATGDLYIADVGQNAWEEANVQSAASAGGENYGWNRMEGTHCYNGGCSQSGLTMPVLDYGHSQGCSITGGYVYRGSAVPSLVGQYLYADYCTGWVRSFQYQAGQAGNRLDRDELTPGGNITSFGEDARGELYILTQNGRVHRIVPR